MLLLFFLFLHENEWDERIHIFYIKIVGIFFLNVWHGRRKMLSSGGGLRLIVVLPPARDFFVENG